MKRLYVVVRADLDAGAQAAQAMHAALGFAVEFPDTTRAWNVGENNLVVLAAPDEAALERICAGMPEGTHCYVFHEPDLGDSFTAMAFAGTDDARKLVSSLPLALRRRVEGSGREGSRADRSPAVPPA